MPTTRPRYQVTETDEIRRAIDRAALVWPGETRARLLLRVIDEGQAALAHAEIVRARLRALDRVAGSAGDAYEPGYLERLREDWPE